LQERASFPLQSGRRFPKDDPTRDKTANDLKGKRIPECGNRSRWKTGSRGWIRLGALGSFLERSRHRYAALFDSNFIAEGIIAIKHSPRSTRSWPTLEVRSGGKRH